MEAENGLRQHGKLSTMVSFLLSSRTLVKIKFGSTTSAEIDYTGDAYITSYEQEAGTEENVTFSFGFTGTGVLTQAAVS